MRAFKQRVADVPFRVGHHFASELVNHGRSHALKPLDIPYAEARRIYADVAGEAGLGRELPLDETAFRDTLSARHMIEASRGLGGPQPDEVARMLREAQMQLEKDRGWLNARRQAVVEAERALDAAFARLRGT